MNNKSDSYDEQEITLKNPNLDNLEVDYLYHLGLHSGMDLEKMFGDTKYVCMGGSADRALVFANKAAEILGIEVPEDGFQPIGKTERFSMYKVGPVVSVNHGMGIGSIEILLNEVAKLMAYAKAKGVKFFRLGTSGGIGVEPGTVVITDKAYNDRLEPYHDKSVCGEVEKRNTELSPELAQAIFDCREDISAAIGSTVSATGFYEPQGRLDGAIAYHTEEQKLAWLRKASGMGVKNMEMEATEFAAFCNELGIRSSIICAALLNRLDGDQVTSTPEELAQFADNSQQVVLNYIKKDLG
ncbi:uridine phosphorylase [Patescibacteria group bacterium]|nr:uridine phosphorylase [Patescibacteria group bacterium]MBU1703458.1 uridine phosphorylase [Patescibacteria group bacterium]MBU1953460.1 uridine phosphorylase [Patescibacteria group bacterium]